MHSTLIHITIICVILYIMILCSPQYEHFGMDNIPILGPIFRSIGAGFNNMMTIIYIIIGIMVLGMLINFLSLFKK
jgi:hypothetical protein